ncbi:hypothetical protein D3C87_76740 [compost metagenome]
MEFENCPICDSKLITSNHTQVVCKNDCYFTEKWRGFTNHCFMRPGGGKSIKLPFYDNDIDSERERKLKIVDEVVDFWKTNDRYIVEILNR